MSRREVLLLVAILVAAAILRSRGLAAPIERGLRGSFMALNGLMVENYRALGLAATGGAQVVNIAPTAESQLVYYQHHPPLANLLSVPFYALFDGAEVGLRMLPLIGSTAMVGLLFVLARSLLGVTTALAAAFFAAISPMGIFYGAYAGYAPLWMPVLCVSMLLYLRFLRLRTPGALALLTASMVTGCLIDWTGLYIPVLIVADHLLRDRGRRTMALFVPLAACLAVFVLHHVYLGNLVASTATRPSTFLAHILTSMGLGAEPFHWGQGALQLAGFLASYYTVPVLLLALAGLLLSKPPGAARLFPLLLLPGAFHCVIFARKAATEDYWTGELLPGIALAAGWGLVCLYRRVPSRGLMAVMLAGVFGLGMVRVDHHFDFALGQEEPVPAGAGASAWVRRWLGLEGVGFEVIRQRARRLAAVTSPGDVLFLPAVLLKPETSKQPMRHRFYSRRDVYRVRRPADLTRWEDDIASRGLQSAPHYLVLATRPDGRAVTGAFGSWVARRGSGERRGEWLFFRIR